ncbi:MAG: protein-tyrosine-phosphatase [Pseudomonadota bacterium]
MNALAKPDKPLDEVPGDKPVEQPKSVLFICNHNVIRSTMAEALTRARYGKRIYVASAGVTAGTPDPFVEAVLLEIGIEWANHEPQELKYLDDGYFDLIITLSPQAHHVALERAHVEAMEVDYWPAADPTVVTGSREQRLDAYRDVRDRIAARIKERFGAP